MKARRHLPLPRLEHARLTVIISIIIVIMSSSAAIENGVIAAFLS